MSLGNDDGDGNENGKKAKQQLCTCIMLFCTFLCRHCSTTTWRCLIARFMESANKRRRIFPSLSKLECGPALRKELWGNSPTFHIFSELVHLNTRQSLKKGKFSVLTRILPWGVPGPPLLRNRGPVRTLGGQSYKKHAVRRTWARTPNCLLHEVPTWSNMAEEVFTIRRRSLRCSGTCVGPMKVKATKLKTLTHLISCFLFIQTNRML